MSVLRYVSALHQFENHSINKTREILQVSLNGETRQFRFRLFPPIKAIQTNSHQRWELSSLSLTHHHKIPFGALPIPIHHSHSQHVLRNSDCERVTRTTIGTGLLIVSGVTVNVHEIQNCENMTGTPCVCWLYQSPNNANEWTCRFSTEITGKRPYRKDGSVPHRVTFCHDMWSHITHFESFRISKRMNWHALRYCTI